LDINTDGIGVAYTDIAVGPFDIAGRGADDRVGARQQHAMVIADIGIGKHRMCVVLYPDLGPHGCSVDPIGNQTPDPDMHCFEVGEHGFFVVRPKGGNQRGVGFLGVGKLDSHFIAAYVAVIPVLHAAGDDVPSGAVGNAVRKTWAVPHGQVRGGIPSRYIFKQEIIGRGFVLADHRTVIVVGIIDHECAGMKVGGEDETVRDGPFHDPYDFERPAFLPARFAAEKGSREISEILRERAVQVVAIGIKPRSQFKSIGIHNGNNPDRRRIHKIRDPCVTGIIVQEMVD